MPLRCALCFSNLPSDAVMQAPGTVYCAHCGEQNSARAFPAMLVDPGNRPPPLPPEPPKEGEAACFYSPERKATQVCAHCGALISDIWSAHWGTQIICLKCLDHLRDNAKDQRFERGRRLWDNITLAVSALPLTVFFWWSFFFAGPTALFLGLRHWRSPGSMVPRSHFRMMVALFLALLQVIGICVYVAAIFFDLSWIKTL